MQEYGELNGIPGKVSETLSQTQTKTKTKANTKDLVA
jgi:hypothetical protein